MATELQVVNSALTKIGAPLITQAQYDNGSTKEARLTKERLPHVRQDLLRSHPWNVAIKRVDSVSITTTGAHGTPTSGAVAVSALTSALPAGLEILFSGGITLTVSAGGAALDAVSISGTIPSGAIASGETASTWTSAGSALANTAPDFEYSYSIPLPTDLLRLLDVNDSDKDYRVESGNLISNYSSPNILYVFDLGLASFGPNLIETLAWKLGFDISYAITQSQGVWEMAERGYETSFRRAKTIDAQEDGRYHVEANLFDDSRYGTSIFADYRNHHRP